MLESLTARLANFLPLSGQDRDPSVKTAFSLSSDKGLVQSYVDRLVGPKVDYKRFVIGSSWALWGLQDYITLRQMRTYALPEPPAALASHVSMDTYTKAQAYGKDKAKLSLVKSFVSQTYNWFWVYKDLYAKAWQISGNILDKIVGRNTAGTWPISQSIIFSIVNSLPGLLISIPIGLYSTFVVEERHGFNKSTLGIFFSDQAKQLLLGLVIGAPITAVLLKIVEWAGDGFVKYLMVFFLVFIVVLQLIYPTFIQPLFNKLTPLPQGDLRDRVEKLAGELGFPLKHLYVIDGSKRSGHSNAYFYGLPWSKHIVIFDTLIEHSTPEEIEAVLAHELGHWKYAHITKLLFVNQFQLFFSLSLFAAFVRNPRMYSSFGFNDDIAQRQQPVFIGFTLFNLITSCIDPLLSLSINAITRQYEYQADRFAIQLGKKKELASALIKLHNKNLSSPHNDWLYSTWHHSHPTLIERLRAMDQYEAELAKKGQ